MYKYDWKDGRVTLNWLAPTVALVRVHNDAEVIPGPYECVVTVKVENDGYELMGFCGKRPKASEFKSFYAYLASLGLKEEKRQRFSKKPEGALCSL